jgi:hypothetical protein
MAMSLGRARRWTRGEYDRLISLVIFRPGEHLELLGGHLIVSEPQGSFHSAAVGLVDEAGLERADRPEAEGLEMTERGVRRLALSRNQEGTLGWHSRSMRLRSRSIFGSSTRFPPS